MIDRDHPLSVVGQCELLALPRSTLYYQPAGTPAEELAMMRHIDELHLRFPWMGSRSVRDQLNRARVPISRDRVRRLMRKLGIRALYRKPRTTIPQQGHKVYLELTRFRGHLNIWETGVHDVEAKSKQAVRAGVPATDGRAGSVRARSGRAGAGVRALGAGDPQLGGAGGS